MTLLLLKFGLMFVLLALSAFFAASETALMSLSRLQLARLAKAHPGRLEFWQRDPDRVIAVLLLGNNLAHVGLGVLATSVAITLDGLGALPFRWGAWVIPAVTTLVGIFFGEVSPKVAARHAAEPLALGMAGVLRFLVRLAGPVVEGLLTRTEVLLAWLSRTIKAEKSEWDAPVIRALLQNGSLAPRLRTVLNNLLDFGNLPVSRVMVPREEVFAMDLSVPRREFIERILWSGYSRCPVYRGSLDKVEGIVYAKDLLTYGRRESLIILQDIIRPVLRVPPETPVAHLLRDFRRGHNHMALVEKGGRVQGLVTLQDVLEAIVGEVAEEPELQLE